jgi:HK97 family phage prohead protease
MTATLPMVPTWYARTHHLEDISIRSDGTGRTVEAYAAVFDVPAAIHDIDGEYQEVLDPGCFDRAIANWRNGAKVGVFYNHGVTLTGAPSDKHSMPIGVPTEIRAEPRGLFTVTKFSRNTLADEVLEAIREGSIEGYSFSGAFRRSSPPKPPGGYRRDNSRDQRAPTVRRLESTLREYGPCPFPAYQSASILGMRNVSHRSMTRGIRATHTPIVVRRDPNVSTRADELRETNRQFRRRYSI